MWERMPVVCAHECWKHESVCGHEFGRTAWPTVGIGPTACVGDSDAPPQQMLNVDTRNCASSGSEWVATLPSPAISRTNFVWLATPPTDRIGVIE